MTTIISAANTTFGAVFRVSTEAPNPIDGKTAIFTWEVRVRWIDAEKTEAASSTRCVGNSTKGQLAPPRTLRPRARRAAVRRFRAG